MRFENCIKYYLVILALSLLFLRLFYFNYSPWNNCSWISPWHHRVITSFANKIFSKRQYSLLIYYFEVFFVLKITIVNHAFSYLKSHKILLNSHSCTIFLYSIPISINHLLKIPKVWLLCKLLPLRQPVNTISTH